MKTYLTVTAHPDDEILGFGGTSKILTSKGHRVVNLILSSQVEARRHKPSQLELESDTANAQVIVGADPAILGGFPNIKFNTVPHLELVQFIEKYIEEIQPDYIFTHHPYDLNNDHYHTSKACQAAARLFQRKPIKPIKGLYFMEIPSSTDWSFSIGCQKFVPDTFVEVGEEGVEAKLKALSCYKEVMRDFPHPRSEEVIKSYAAIRGAESGLKYAEAFQVAFNILVF
jgi:LmbE family N-acetylglucosaminyl deacetylase